jgi:hypothetical protein
MANEQPTRERYEAREHITHKREWTVFDVAEQHYRLRGLTETEARQYAAAWNTQTKVW